MDIGKRTVRLVIADDRPQSREGLRALFGTCCGVEIVGEAADGAEALKLVESRHPSVVVMDVRMPGMDGLEATRAIKSRWPEVKVVVLTMYMGCRTDALAAGADAFLVKGGSAEVLLEAISS